MAILSYDLETSLSGHIDSVNTLRFSPTGKYLASGGQDGQLFIFSTKTWKLVRKYVDTSPLTTVVWHPSYSKAVVCGFASGDLTTICFDGTQVHPFPILRASVLHFPGPERGKDMGGQDVRRCWVYRPRCSGDYNRDRSR